MKSLRTAVWMGLMLASLGCSQQPQGETLTIENVPENLMKVAREQAPDINWMNAYSFERNGEIIYEIRGRNQHGKIIQIEVNEDGRLVAVE